MSSTLASIKAHLLIFVTTYSLHSYIKKIISETSLRVEMENINHGLRLVKTKVRL